MDLIGITIFGGVNIQPPPPPPAPPSVIGQSYGGGYYAGQISTTGNGVATHYLIVAPKASGQPAYPGLAMKTSATATAGTSSDIDGPTNTNNMNNASHPAAQYCKGLTIGGYTDWYLPSKNELEVCYYNLKPTTTGNQYGTPNSIVEYGANPNAVPSRNAHTLSDPTQTSVAIFQTGGAESFETYYFWSSTQNTNYADTHTWLQTFSSGQQVPQGKADPQMLRAVRRIPV